MTITPEVRILINVYRGVMASMKSCRDRLFPPGCHVIVTCPGRYCGPGLAMDSSELPPDQVAVLLGNGNVWWYPIETVEKA